MPAKRAGRVAPTLALVRVPRCASIRSSLSVVALGARWATSSVRLATFPQGSRRARERRFFATLGALVFVFGLGGPAAWNAYVESLGPLDLASARLGSTIVVDRDGRLLRAFTLPDGRWRLPTTAGEVDPRYLAMLLAYEDGALLRPSTASTGARWRAPPASGRRAAMSSPAARR